MLPVSVPADRDVASGKVFLAVDANCAFVKENLKKPDSRNTQNTSLIYLNNLEFSEIMKNNPALFSHIPMS